MTSQASSRQAGDTRGQVMNFSSHNYQGQATHQTPSCEPWQAFSTIFQYSGPNKTSCIQGVGTLDSSEVSNQLKASYCNP